jgi:hypothetical protein
MLLGEGDEDGTCSSQEEEDSLKRLISSTEVGILPVPPDVTASRDGETLALVLSDLLTRGAGLGKYGGRMLIHFENKPTRNLWEDKDVVETCKKALETDPGILDAMVWEDHPKLEFEVPDAEDRSVLPGRLWFVSILEPSLWKKDNKGTYSRDPEESRKELKRWQEKAAKIRS